MSDMVGLPFPDHGQMNRRATERDPRGYFGIALWHPKAKVNLGTLLRSAHIFGAAFIATIGERYQRQSSDTIRVPRHTPLFHFADETDFWAHIPHDCQPVAVELAERAKPLVYFSHPQRAVYILGPEDGSLPAWFISGAHAVVEIPGKFCLNLAVAGSIVLYDRIAKETVRHDAHRRSAAVESLCAPKHSDDAHEFGCTAYVGRPCICATLRKERALHVGSRPAATQKGDM